MLSIRRIYWSIALAQAVLQLAYVPFLSFYDANFEGGVIPVVFLSLMGGLPFLFAYVGLAIPTSPQRKVGYAVAALVISAVGYVALYEAGWAIATSLGYPDTTVDA